jgi:hypothetical protein
MEKPIENYWQERLTDLKEALEANNFEAFLADNSAEAKQIVLGEIIPKTDAKSVSWGGSMIFIDTGLYKAIKGNQDLEILDFFDKNITEEENMELRRRALLVDLFITGTRVHKA